jgi:tetratricopeptide (TPR) repeat protein
VALLEVCAFLGPEEIPRDLFGQRLDPPAQGLEVLAADPFALDDAIAALRRYGLVKADEQALTVHRLLQQVVRARLLPHAQAATEHAARLEVESLATASLLDNAADYLLGRARYAEAYGLRERSLAILEARLGADHPDTASILSNLALVLRDQGDSDGARALYERALAIREARLGADHPYTARSRQNLAAVVARLQEQP